MSSPLMCNCTDPVGLWYYSAALLYTVSAYVFGCFGHLASNGLINDGAQERLCMGAGAHFRQSAHITVGPAALIYAEFRLSHRSSQQYEYAVVPAAGAVAALYQPG